MYSILIVETSEGPRFYLVNEGTLETVDQFADADEADASLAYFMGEGRCDA